MTKDRYLLRMEGVEKSFPGVKALGGVTLEVNANEVHAVVGENGAGKSTLMKILAGAISPDRGTIVIDGEEVTLSSPGRAQSLGIAMIHQELALVPYLTVGQNIFLGREPGVSRKLPGIINWRRLYHQAGDILRALKLELNPHDIVATLPVAQQQMVEVAKALSLNSKVIIMDEPTSALTDRETEILFERIEVLKSRGIGVIYISHRMEEIFRISQRITVLRDGTLVGSLQSDATTRDEVVRMMVGRELEECYSKSSTPGHEELLRVEGLSRRDKVKDVNLSLRRGEIVGLFGLVGAGRTELARAIFRIDPPDDGVVLLDGKKLPGEGPKGSIAGGIGFLTENRKEQGLFMMLGVRANITIGVLKEFSRFGLLRFSALNKLADSCVQGLKIRTPHLQQRVVNLSGGNQQKALLARWLSLKPKVLILDEPTKGVDIGAKMEIYSLIDSLAGEGMGIILISSELPEILGISDRIVVMRQGELVGEYSRKEATQDLIMHSATGGAG